MFVKNLKDEFYSVIYGHRCLILVNFDIDAICASKILQSLFKYDHMVYTMVPVQGIQDMIDAYSDNYEEVKYVIMINCGGTVDVVELLQPSPNNVFYILDSHRPYDLCNIYSEGQVKILGELDSDDEIPDYNDVFRESDDEDDFEDDDHDENESTQVKRRRLEEERLIKRREFREWQEKRHNIMFNYLQYSYYGKSSAVLAFEMTWQMSRDNLDMAWWAIVGATEQELMHKIETRVSVLEAGNLQSHISRLSHRRGGNVDQQQGAIKLTYDKDLQLALYRHWTVEASLRHSMATAVSLRLWSIKGESRLRRLLAEMGLPLAQSKQRFSTMDLNLRQEFRQMVEKLASKYKIDSIVGASFMFQYGYRFKYCSSDVVYAMLALMESSSKEKLPQQCFLDAADCLSHVKKDVLERGIEKAKMTLCNIFKTAQIILETKQVMNAGTFLYAVVSEGTMDSQLFSHPHALIMLAQFTLRAYVEGTRNRHAPTWPLVISAVYKIEEGTCLVVGVPPVCEDQPRSLFGEAFKKAAENTNSEIDTDYFDATITRLKILDRSKFFDGLAALLAE